MNTLPNIRGILFDLDGVLYVGAEAIAGATATVAQIRASGIACRFVTNTSTLSLASLQSKLAKLGFDVAREEIVSAPQAAVLYLRQQGNPRCRLLLAEDVKRDFAEFRQVEHAADADYIVIGDIGNAWSYALLNDAFQALIGGARLIAIHKNRFWQTADGLQMDIGGFVTALEYASGVSATLIGKPAPDFFRMALASLDLPPQQVAMIGDDIDADIGGAQRAGLTGILVQTGKYRPDHAAASATQPDRLLASIADLPALLAI